MAVQINVCAVAYCYAVAYVLLSGFGGLEVACWPLVPKFAVSNRIFQGEKTALLSFLRKDSKAVFSMS